MNTGESEGPERTPDGHFIVVDGRRWRASDPQIPENLRAELVAELMDARRAVRDARGAEAETAAARARVQDAKVALGERGLHWWEPVEPERRAERLAAAMRTLLRHRDADKTICPSDAARIVGGEGWRDAMEPARDVARQLIAERTLIALQHGAQIDLAAAKGPIRLGRGPTWS